MLAADMSASAAKPRQNERNVPMHQSQLSAPPRVAEQQHVTGSGEDCRDGPVGASTEGKAKENEGELQDQHKEEHAITHSFADTVSNADEQEQEQEQEDDALVSSRGEPKGPPQACLFVASLSPDTPEDALHEFFACFGEVLKIKLMKDRSSRPYAFVQYSSTEEAINALHQTNNAMLDGRRLRVEKAKVNRTLFIAKMNRSLTNQKLRETVECYGPVESVTIIKNHQTQKSKGCGFVKFVFREDAMDAYLGLKNQFRKWVVEWATSTNDPDVLGVDKFNVFVGGLNPQLVTKTALEERFGSYGPLESVTLVNRDDQHTHDMTGAPLRSAFAFVRYSEASASASAIEQENGAEWLERRIRVQYCESLEMKNKRRTQKYLNTLATTNPYLPNAAAPYYPSTFQYPAPMMMMGGVPMYMGASSPGASSSGAQKFNAYGMNRGYYTPDVMGQQQQQHQFYGNSFPSYPAYAMGLGTAPPYSPTWMYGSDSPQMYDDQGLGIEETGETVALLQQGEDLNGAQEGLEADEQQDPAQPQWQVNERV